MQKRIPLFTSDEKAIDYDRQEVCLFLHNSGVVTKVATIWQLANNIQWLVGIDVKIKLIH